MAQIQSGMTKVLTPHSLCLWCSLWHGRAHPTRHSTRSCWRQCPETSTHGFSRPYLLRNFRDGRRICDSTRADPTLRQQLLIYHNPHILCCCSCHVVVHTGRHRTRHQSTCPGESADLCQGRCWRVLLVLRILLDRWKDHLYASKICLVAAWLRRCIIRSSIP